MTRAISFDELPGSERSSRFDGHAHGAPISFFISRFPPGARVNRHRHPYEETFVVQEGEATFVVAGETVAAGGGSIVVVPAGAAHEFVNTGTTALRQISIHAADRMVTEWLED